MCVLWHVIVGLASQRLDNASSLKSESRTGGSGSSNVAIYVGVTVCVLLVVVGLGLSFWYFARCKRRDDKKKDVGSTSTGMAQMEDLDYESRKTAV